MSTNENTRIDLPEGATELGVATIETKGGGGTPNEALGFIVMPGLSED